MLILACDILILLDDKNNLVNDTLYRTVSFICCVFKCLLCDVYVIVIENIFSTNEIAINDVTFVYLLHSHHVTNDIRDNIHQRYRRLSDVHEYVCKMINIDCHQLHVHCIGAQTHTNARARPRTHAHLDVVNQPSASVIKCITQT